MAEVEIELKDEELLDFDGSDYEFGSDEGVNLEDEVAAVDELENGADKSSRQMIPVESVEIHQEERKDEAGLDVDRKSAGDRKPKLPRSSSAKATDLEDGELSDMVNSKKQPEHGVVKDVRPSRKHSSETMRDDPDREAERNGDIRHDRKRRKDHDYDKHQYSSRDRKEPYDRHAGRYDRGDRRHDRYAAFPDPRTRGRNSHAQNFRPNLSPGIMGPGRPLRPDMNYHIRPSTAGLEIFSPAQLQELLNQEHMLRTQQMLLQSRLGIRPPPPMYPFINPNFLRAPLPTGSSFMGPPRGTFPASGAGILGGVGMHYPSSNEPLPPSSTRGQHREPDYKSDHSKPVSRSKPETYRRSTPPRRSQDSYRESDHRRDGNAAGGSRSNDYNGNLIHLGGPVQKSRVLIVSGLQENTPMSTVADAFEKQGKILDFRKNQRGNVFTVTFSTVQEALSAKRHLHRSILAGRQITVEYAV